MRLKPLHALLVVGLTLAMGVGVLAQRGGGIFNNYFGRSASNNVKYDGKFQFVRMSYPSGGRGNSSSYPAWSHDYPTGEEHFMSILTNVSNINAHVNQSSIMSFSDPEMFKNPVIYICEPGFWRMSDEEVVNLRNYLLKGGFLVVDDFHWDAWPNFDQEMSRVFPQGQWIDLDINHPIFHSFFEIPNLDMPPPLPALGDKCIYRGLFEDNDPTKRMYAIANYQNDISEYWEYSASGRFAVDTTNEAYKFGVNEFIYGITH